MSALVSLCELVTKMLFMVSLSERSTEGEVVAEELSDTLNSLTFTP